MTAETSYINCPTKPGHRCTLNSCVANPLAPECVQLRRKRAELPTITNPKRIGGRGGPLNKAINTVYKSTGRLN